MRAVEGLEAQLIGCRSLIGAIDTTTADGKLVFHIFASLAEVERSIIRERARRCAIAVRWLWLLIGRPCAWGGKVRCRPHSFWNCDQ